MVKTTTLGGTAADVVVGKVAHGLMTMTVMAPIPDEQAFETIKSGIDALPPGAKMVLNSAEFYGRGDSLGNLELLARFFDKYPEYTARVFLSVKGGKEGFSGNPQELKEKIQHCVDKCNSALRGTKKIDLFQPGRLLRGVPVEDVVRALAELLKEGKFDHIGLSECRAESLRRGNAVYPISIVEIEVSPMAYEEETKKVLAAAEELGVAVAAYSPLGHGMTAGTIQTKEDLSRNPFHKHGFARFKEENWEYNKRLVDALASLAAKKGCTPAQLSIAWVASLGEKVIPLPGSTRKERTLENLHASDVQLSKADLDEIANIMETNPVHGARYFGDEHHENQKLWG
ncbi:aldo/keto reductase [Fomes fomentarius]|nr:aldo/keto reductase [Fomes fomentarius]